MARRPSRTLTEVELEFMHHLWALEEASTEDLLQALAEKGRSLTDGSVRKILSILVDKGHVKRRKEGRGFLYRAVVGKEQASGRIVKDLLKRVFDGSAAQMIASLMDVHRVNDDELKRVKQLIADKERGASKKRKKRRRS